MIDLRSDTVTKPTPGMLTAMMAAEVGDDVYGEDPSINQLEKTVSKILRKEAAVFVPTGTMANQIAVRLHCAPGTEILCDTLSHVALWEGGAPAALSGVSLNTIPGKHGLLDLESVQQAVRPTDIHSPQSRLLWLEITHNRGGGTIPTLQSVAEMCNWAIRQGLARHLDGARIWNAAVATGIAAAEWATHFDTVSVCFSKGLGAPVGSALAGSSQQMQLARRYRKLFGGAMRQAGYLAAACEYALEHQMARLQDDHSNAKLIAAAVAKVPSFQLNPADVQTNLVWFDVDPKWGTAQEVTRKLKEQGILMSALGTQTVRACTHLNVSTAECEKASEIIRTIR